MHIYKKQILIFVAIIFIMVITAAGYLIITRKASKARVFDTKDQCEKEAGSSCIYYLCDIPIGDLYQKLCVNGSGSGWYSSFVTDKE